MIFFFKTANRQTNRVSLSFIIILCFYLIYFCESECSGSSTCAGKTGHSKPIGALGGVGLVGGERQGPRWIEYFFLKQKRKEEGGGTQRPLCSEAVCVLWQMWVCPKSLHLLHRPIATGWSCSVCPARMPTGPVTTSRVSFCRPTLLSTVKSEPCFFFFK